MNRTLCAAILAVGVLLGLVFAGGLHEQVVEAQGGSWQCRSWTLEENGDATAVGTWLGSARAVQVTSAGLSAGSRYALTACKQ